MLPRWRANLEPPFARLPHWQRLRCCVFRSRVQDPSWISTLTKGWRFQGLVLVSLALPFRGALKWNSAFFVSIKITQFSRSIKKQVSSKFCWKKGVNNSPFFWHLSCINTWKEPCGLAWWRFAHWMNPFANFGRENTAYALRCRQITLQLDVLVLRKAAKKKERKRKRENLSDGF